MPSKLTNKQKKCVEMLRFKARAKEKITYKDLATYLQYDPKNEWKDFLDPIAESESEETGHDTTLVVINQVTQLTSMFEGRPLDLNDKEQVKKYHRKLKDLYSYWASR